MFASAYRQHVWLTLRIVIWLEVFFGASSAFAIPTLKDHWHFSCSTGSTTQKRLNQARHSASRSGLDGAVGALKYACLLELQEIEAFNARLAKFQEQGAPGQQPAFDSRRSSHQLKRAAFLLARAHKASSSNPKALYYYAYALALLGDVSAVNRFDDLMRSHPNSPYTGDAYLALGEHYFEKRDLEKAYREYEHALKRARPITQAYTRYKMAWINFSLGFDAKDVAKQRKAIADLAHLKKSVEEAKNRQMRRLAALIETDVIQLLAQRGDLNEAKRILAQIDGDDLYAGLIERMAFAKLESGDAVGAYNLFTQALKANPKSPGALAISANLVAIAAQVNDIKRLLYNLQQMVSTYAKDPSPWRSTNKGAIRKKAEAQVEALLVDYAVSLDRQGRESSNQTYLNAAEQLYALYLKHYSKTKRSYEVRTLYGQLLFVRQKHLQAARFMLNHLKKTPKGAATKDIAELMVTAAQFAVDKDATAYKIPEPGTARTPLKIPPVRRTYADGLDMFIKLQPSNPNTAAMTYAAASVYYDFGHYEEALKRYHSYIRKYPTDEFAKPAAVRILVYHQNAKDQKGYQAAKKAIAAITPLRTSPELAAFFTSSSASSSKAALTKPESAEHPDIGPSSEPSHAAQQTGISPQTVSTPPKGDGDQTISE